MARRSLGSVAVPSGSISLTSRTIPNSGTITGGQVFHDCNSLAGVYFQGNAPSGSYPIVAPNEPFTVYYLPGMTGWGTTFRGCPTALWTNPLILDGSVGVKANGFGFQAAWVPNVSLLVEASTDLRAPAWSPLRTNTLAGGAWDFRDPQWPDNPERFYRVRAL